MEAKGLSSRLKFFSGFESDRLAGRNVGYFSGSGVAPYAAFSWLYDKDTEASKLDSLAALKGLFHRLEQRFHSYFGFDFWNAGFIRNVIHNV
jgi:hypothetical protein